MARLETDTAPIIFAPFHAQFSSSSLPPLPAHTFVSRGIGVMVNSRTLSTDTVFLLAGAAKRAETSRRGGPVRMNMTRTSVAFEAWRALVACEDTFLKRSPPSGGKRWRPRRVRRFDPMARKTIPAFLLLAPRFC